MPAILKSKKFQVFVLGSVMVFLTEVMGFDEATAASIKDGLVKLAGAYLVGQGVADHGKGKIEAEASEKQTD